MGIYVHVLSSRFAGRLYAFDNFRQAYDILYFRTGRKDTSLIMDEISRGETIYARGEA